MILFDDRQLILRQYNFIKNIRNIPAAFKQDAFMTSGQFSNYYRPLNTISFIVDAQFCKYDRPCYHVSNIISHILFSFLLYILFTKLKIKKNLSVLITLLFSVHPVIVPAVVWITGRIDILLGIFFLSGFLCFLEWLDNQKYRLIIAHLFFFNLALYTKESALILIPICLFYFVYVKKKALSVKGEALLILGWFISIGIWFILRGIAVHNYHGKFSDQISITNLPGIILYLGKVIPINLSVIPILKDSSLLPGIFVTFLSLGIIYLFRKNRVILFGFFWILLLVLPAITQPGPKVNAYFLEHRMYLPIVGFFIVIGTIFSLRSRYEKLFLRCGIVLILLFAYMSYRRSDYYKDAFMFANQAIKDSPHSANSFEQLGYVYQFVNNDSEKALIAYRKSLELSPLTAFAHVNIGMIYLEKGMDKEAESEMLEELKLGGSDYVWLQLGRVYYVQNRLHDALYAWEQAYAFSQTNVAVMINLAMVNADLGNYAKAKQFYVRAIDLGGLATEDKVRLEKIKFLEGY